MRIFLRTLAMAGLAVAAGCTDAPTAPTTERTAALPDVGARPPRLGVGTMGTVVDVKPNEHGLVVEQFAFEYKVPPGRTHGAVRDSFAVGGRKNRLQVHVRKDTTQVWIRDSLKSLADVRVGDKVLVVGQLTGASLHADMITDLARLDLADSTIRKLPKRGGAQASSALRALAQASGTPMQVTSLCLGQDLDYTGTDVAEFQGCWGGPMASDIFDLGFIPILCPIVGCFGIGEFSYTMALGGWGFAFPYRFKAQPPAGGLTYHVPGDVTLAMEPLPATAGAFSFSGGLGLTFGLGIEFCSFFGCYDIYTLQISAFSMIHQTQGAGPLEGTLDIAEVACPSIGLIPIEGVPIDPLSMGLCEDVGLDGRPFYADVRSIGAAGPAVWRRHGFTNAALPVRLRPDAMQVGMQFDGFSWAPHMRLGLFFRFKIFGATVYNTPTIDFGDQGAFDAVPLGSAFTVATDPLSPPDALRYLHQPTTKTINLAVAPAATTLAFTSPAVLTEGTPVVVRLGEAYDGSAIAGHAVVLEAQGVDGTRDTALVATTDASGSAAVVLPVGEYRLVARYAGAATYLASTANQAPVFVYRPTTFVIWGGNAGGVAAAMRAQFWGQGWTRQVTGGAWGGNASFQGFALPLTATTWSSPPASSAHGPATVPDLIGVIVTTAAQGQGSRTTGNIASHAVLRVDAPAAYRPDGGHGSTGVVRVLLP